VTTLERREEVVFTVGRHNPRVRISLEEVLVFLPRYGVTGHDLSICKNGFYFWKGDVTHLSHIIVLWLLVCRAGPRESMKAALESI
jgi:hypothetical protein